MPVHAGILGSDDCGRSGNCNPSRHKPNKSKAGRPGLVCGTAQLPASPGGEKAASCLHTSRDKRLHIHERYPPVLAPHTCHHFVDLVAGLCVSGGSQVSIDGSGGGRSVSQITLDNAQIDTRFQQMGGVRMAQSVHSRILVHLTLVQRRPKCPLNTGFMQRFVSAFW